MNYLEITVWLEEHQYQALADRLVDDSNLEKVVTEILQNLYEKYQEEGLEILDFPCNQFGNQAPGTNEEIVSFCDANFGVTFPHYAKIDVNGEKAHPLYRFLKQALIARYGEEWYEQLEYAAREIETGNIEIPPR